MPSPASDPVNDRAAILIHGLGSRGSDLDQVASAIGVRVESPDLRGHGDSPPCDFSAIADFAADLEPAARSAAPVLVAGFSFGAWIALELWRRAPQDVCAVALVDPPRDYSALVEWAGGQTRSRRGAMRKLGALYRARDLETATALMREHPLTCELDAEGTARNAKALLAADPASLQGALRLAVPDPATIRPPGDTTPLLVLHGSRSLVCPAPAACELAEMLGGDAAAYDGGHCAHLEAPAEVGAALRELMDSSGCGQPAA